MTLADRLHRTLFARDVDPATRARFDAAAERLARSFPAEEVAEFHAAVAAVGDLEALEMACRVTGRLPLLSRHFLLMVYLAEADPRNCADIVNRCHNVTGAWAALVAGALRTAWCLAKGLVLMRKVPRCTR